MSYRLAILSVILLFVSYDSVGQCDYDNTYVTTVFPPLDGMETVFCIDAGQYFEVAVEEGYTYTFSTCNWEDWESQLSLYADFGATFIGSDETFCADGAQITWVATFTGFIDVLVDEHNCQHDEVCQNVDIIVVPPDDGGGGGGNPGGDGCNTDVILCQNTAGPFSFGVAGPPIGSCQDWLTTSQFAYIMVNITTDGPLSMLIEGDATSGFLDVSVWNIPNNIPPCEAIQDLNNELGCNYASAFSGCNQFGFEFPCPSSVPAPDLVAGQTIMIVVEDWGNGPSSNFTLQLGPLPNAQSGPPDATIDNFGPYCVSSGPVQLTAVNMGGTWTGPGVSPTGGFDPSVAGIGIFPVDYSIGQGVCQSNGSAFIEVIDGGPTATMDVPELLICEGLETNLIFSGTPNSVVEFIMDGAVYTATIGNDGTLIYPTGPLYNITNVQLLSVTLLGNPPCIVPLSEPVYTINLMPAPITSDINHN
jgi:hypothetical protein